MATFSPTLDRALAVSATAHRHQERKGSQVPYIIHPVHVAILLMRHDFPEEVIVAALLHDVVEDTTVTVEDLAREFGPEVARLVAAVSEQKLEGTELLPWRHRKQAQLEHLLIRIDPFSVCIALGAGKAVAPLPDAQHVLGQPGFLLDGGDAEGCGRFQAHDAHLSRTKR